MFVNKLLGVYQPQWECIQMKVRQKYQRILHSVLGTLNSSNNYWLEFGNQHCMVSKDFRTISRLLQQPTYQIQRIEQLGQRNIRSLLKEYEVMSQIHSIVDTGIADWHQFWREHAFILERTVPKTFGMLVSYIEWRHIFQQLIREFTPILEGVSESLLPSDGYFLTKRQDTVSEYGGEDIFDCQDVDGSIVFDDCMFLWTKTHVQCRTIPTMLIKWIFDHQVSIFDVSPSESGVFVLSEDSLIVLDQMGQLIMDMEIPKRTFDRVLPFGNGHGCILLPKIFSGHTIRLIREIQTEEHTEIPFHFHFPISDTLTVLSHEDLDYFVLLNEDWIPQQVFKGHENSIEQVKPFNDGLVSCSADSTIRVWNWDGTVRASMEDESSDTISGVHVLSNTAVLFWKGGWRCRDSNLYCWDIVNNEVNVVYKYSAPVVDAFSKDDVVWVWDESGLAVLVDVSGAVLKELQINDGRIQCTVSADWVLSWSRYTNRASRSIVQLEDYGVRVWTPSGECVAHFDGHQYFIEDCVQIGTGFVSISASVNGTIRTWGVSKETTPSQKKLDLRYLRCSSEFILGWTKEEIVMIGSDSVSHRQRKFSSSLMLVMVWNEQIYCVTSDHRIRCLDYTLETKQEFVHSIGIRMLEPSQNGTCLYAVDERGHLLVFSDWPPTVISVREPVHIMNVVNNRSYIRGFEGYRLVHPDGKTTPAFENVETEITRLYGLSEDTMLVVSTTMDVVSLDASKPGQTLLETPKGFVNCIVNQEVIVAWTQTGEINCWSTEDFQLKWHHNTHETHYFSKPFFGYIVNDKQDVVCSSMGDQFFDCSGGDLTQYSMDTLLFREFSNWLSFWKQHNPHYCSEEAVVYPVSRGLIVLDLRSKRLSTWFSRDEFEIVSIRKRTPIVMMDGQLIELQISTNT